MEYTHEHKRNWGEGLNYLLSMMAYVENDIRIIAIVHAGDPDKVAKLLAIKSHQLDRLKWCIHRYTYEVRFGFDYGRESKPNHTHCHFNH